jgi:gas vesicle protein
MPKLFKAYEKIGRLPNNIKELLEEKYGNNGTISNELYNSIQDWKENNDNNIEKLRNNIKKVPSNKKSNSSSFSKSSSNKKKSKCQGLKPEKLCNDTKGCKYTKGKKRKFCRKSTNKSRKPNISRVKKFLESEDFLDNSIQKLLNTRNKTEIYDYIREWHINKELNDKKLESSIKNSQQKSISISSSISRNSLDYFSENDDFSDNS